MYILNIYNEYNVYVIKCLNMDGIILFIINKFRVYNFSYIGFLINWKRKGELFVWKDFIEFILLLLNLKVVVLIIEVVKNVYFCFKF